MKIKLLSVLLLAFLCSCGGGYYIGDSQQAEDRDAELDSMDLYIDKTQEAYIPGQDKYDTEGSVEETVSASAELRENEINGKLITAALCSQLFTQEYVTCVIPVTFCTYRPDIKGKPTFCNDGPYPYYGFTLLVWGQDWSALDGKCMYVTGNIRLYEGLPQIEATSRSQVEICH
jgi:hypothetical protein